MRKLLQALGLGFALGAVSWIVVPLVSDRFEPHDSAAGFWIGQALTITAAFYFGFSRGITCVVVFIFGTYLGLNAYPYVLGGSEQRAWASLGLITNILLCVLPLIAGLVGIIASFGKRMRAKWLKNEAAKRGVS